MKLRVVRERCVFPLIYNYLLLLLFYFSLSSAQRPILDCKQNFPIDQNILVGRLSSRTIAHAIFIAVFKAVLFFALV